MSRPQINFFKHKSSNAIVLAWPSLMSDNFLSGTVVLPAQNSDFSPEQKLHILAHQNEGFVWPVEQFEPAKNVKIEIEC